MIQQGMMVPFQVGLLSVEAEVLGYVREGTQYLLMIRYYVPDEVTGEPKLIRRLFQRDRAFIEGLYEDSKSSTVRSTRDKKYKRLSLVDTGVESGERGFIRYPEECDNVGDC